jgi:hypothetical protein
MIDKLDSLKLSEEYRKRLNDAGMPVPFFRNKPTFYYDIKDYCIE